MEKKYSKEIMLVLENIAKAMVTDETQEVRLFKNHRGKFILTKTENVEINFQN